MAQKPFVIDQRQREQRQKTYLAAPTIASRFPAISEIAVELNFTDLDGKLYFSPYKQIFVAEMQAYFEFKCPLRECSGGGFNLEEAIARLGSRAGSSESGKIRCGGRCSRVGVNDPRCGVQLSFQLKTLADDVGCKTADRAQPT